MIKGIIFDMDGVLFDTEPFYLRRREDFFKTKGIPIDHLNSKDFIGGNLQELWKELLGKIGMMLSLRQLQLTMTLTNKRISLLIKNC